MKHKLERGTSLKIVLFSILLVMGVITTLGLIPLYPFLHGWYVGDGNKSPKHPFLRFLWATITMYFRG